MTSPAHTTFEQLGGMRLCLMLGCKVWFSDNDLVIHQIRASKAVGRVIVSYLPEPDLYRVRAYKKRKPNDLKCDVSDLYVDQLKEVIEREIGAYISLT